MMKNMALILGFLVAVCLIVACAGQKKLLNPDPLPIYPTATSHFFFRSTTSVGTPLPSSPKTQSGKPTTASVFRIYPTSTPFFVRSEPDETSTPTTEIFATQTLPSRVINVSVYQDDLNPNWEVERSSGMEIYLDDSSQVYHGRTAMSFTPYADYGLLFFTVTGASQEIYPRDRVSQLAFWLYSGDDQLALDQLSVAVISSNSPTFWSADDHPVTTIDQAPVFSETRTYYLPINHPAPAHTWFPVELEFEDTLTTDLDYRYITGFYLKTEGGLSRTLVIDDITLEMLGDGPETPAAPLQKAVDRKEVNVQVDTQQDVHPISELIYGVTGAPAEVLRALRPELNNWGGSSSTRYNWEIGHAWNTGSNGFYRNGNFGISSGSASDDFISQTLDEGAQVRLSLPTLGWVAKNDDPNTCSFPLPDGTCGDAGGATCREPGETADPYLANVPSYLSSVISWVQRLINEKGYKIRFLAMDNEPELWGFTHYDVHPECTTYDEILRKYILYTRFLHTYAPQAELVGPVTSGWSYYWNSAAGDADKLSHANFDFLPWFLSQLRRIDLANGWRSLHVLDLHYFPENVTNNLLDEETAALRLRSTRSLWDKNYIDESWIDEPVYLIPRMKAMIEAYYPGTKLGLSAWNWGAENNINGALALADVLGIFGREDLYYAAHSAYPPINSPGFFAFKMYTNFDGRGGRFGDTSVSAQSSDINVLGSYAALETVSGNLFIMLVNKQVTGETLAHIELGKFIPDKSAQMYRYDAVHPEGIKESTLIVSSNQFQVSLPASSITLLVIRGVK